MKFVFAFVISLIFFFNFTISSISAAPIFTNEKMITVDLGAQQLTAWQDGKIQHQTKVSTGMKLTPTVKGSFKIYYKNPLQDMRGPSPYKDIYPSGKYHIKNVPHSMFFYQGYAIHGAYWHNNFGRVASHGCVNVPLKSAEWLFGFADVGTRVEVY
jgi:lipoprotein-anchoring transpeptidase ErfK/SrfK